MEEIGKIIPGVFKAHWRGAEVPLVEVLGPLWARVVGKGIAQNSRPVAFAAGTLTLETPCSTWAAELRKMAEEIRASTNSFLGQSVVKKLRVRLDRGIESRGDAPGAPRSVDASPAAKGEGGIDGAD